MKTLLEQVINELKLSKASTGNKLNSASKTFGELQPGDFLYWAVGADRTAKDITYKVVSLQNGSIWSTPGYSDLNPIEVETIRRDITINVEKEGEDEITDVKVPSNCTFFITNSIIWATSLEKVYEMKNKLNILKNLK